jgi:hypothetical protein
MESLLFSKTIEEFAHLSMDPGFASQNATPKQKWG